MILCAQTVCLAEWRHDERWYWRCRDVTVFCCHDNTERCHGNTERW